MAALAALRSVLHVYVLGAAVLWAQLLRRVRGGFRPPALPPQPGRVAIVTGATDGIGLCTAAQLAALGMRVVIAGNDREKAQAAVHRIRAETGNDDVDFLFLDLASMASVRAFVREFEALRLPLHVLVNNAGVMFPPRPATTADGLEPHVGVNFLGHFLLTQLLLGALRSAGSAGRRARVVTVASATHHAGELDAADPLGRPAPSPHAAYAGSKLALVLFSLRLQRLLAARGDPVTCSAADPGVADTALFRHAGWPTRLVQRALGWLLFKTPEEAAWTSAYAAAAPELEGVGGLYLRDEAPAACSARARDPALQQRLWAESCRLVGVADETA